MTRQKDLEIELVHLIVAVKARDDITDEEFARRIISIMASQGCVLEVDKKVNGNLTNELYDAMGIEGHDECRLKIKQILKAVGFTATEPLIKGVPDDRESHIGI